MTAISSAPGVSVTDINNRGQVAGYRYDPSEGFSNFVYHNGTTTRLDGFPGNAATGRINDSGSILANGDPIQLGYLYRDGQYRNIDLNGYDRMQATDINSSGHIIGSSYSLSPDRNLSSGFVASNGTTQQLGGPDGSGAYPIAMNDRGQVVGRAVFQPINPRTSWNQRAFLFENGTMKDLGTFGGAYSSAYAINNSGQVVGASSYHVGPHPESLPDTYAFLYDNGKMMDLNDLISTDTDLRLFMADGINDFGQIIARARSGGNNRAILLTPEGITPPESPMIGDAATVPEPSSIALLGLVALVMGVRRAICRYRQHPQKSERAADT